MTSNAQATEHLIYQETNDRKMTEDDPFTLIQKGNAFEAASNHWGSADMYSQASTCLRLQADEISTKLSTTEDSSKTQEQRKIISLYRAQSLEYLYKARHSFIEAVKFENGQDRNRMVEVVQTGKGKLDPLCSIISIEESERRRRIFQTLFLGKECVGVKQVVGGEVDETIESRNTIDPVRRAQHHDDTTQTMMTASKNADLDNLQLSMEARLANLNSSIANDADTIPKAPPPFISGSRSDGGQGSDKSRLEDLHRGLKGLGISLPDNTKVNSIGDRLSDDDQVKMIIQQARDEVMIERGNQSDELQNKLGYSDEIDESDSMFEGFEDEEDDIDSLLRKADNLIAKVTQADKSSSSVSAPASTELSNLQKAQALLMEARLCLELGDSKYVSEATDSISIRFEDGEGGQNDQCSKSSEEDENRKVNSIKAKEKVEDARECLDDILSTWNVGG